ncbi:MAG: polysaccharide pyruvyl transferase family protein, partial [Lentisphaeria bacterium]
MSIKKILLGGIPLGCNNIGDEAIINSVCQIFHRLFPSAELTVMTDDTVDVAWCSKRLRGPLYGFNKDFPASEFASFVKNYDCYVWAGATGLSDYPQVATELLNQSFAAGVPAIVWNVGMNSELNPAFFRVGGKRKALLRFGGALFFGKDSLVALYDCWHVKRMRRKIKKSLSRTALVIVRDPESVEVLHQLGFNGAIAGADSAILQENASQKYLERDARFRTIGLCISAQSELKQMEELVIMLNKFLERTD